MQVTIDDVNEPTNNITLSESQNGNVVIKFKAYRDEVIVKPGELFRAVGLFLTSKDATDDRS